MFEKTRNLVERLDFIDFHNGIKPECDEYREELNQGEIELTRLRAEVKRLKPFEEVAKALEYADTLIFGHCNTDEIVRIYRDQKDGENLE